MSVYRRAVAASGGKALRDYDHSSPDWPVILKLVFPDMKARVDAYPDTPVTAFDVLEFCFVDFIVSEYFDSFQVRAFARSTRLGRRTMRAICARGRTTEAQFREDFRHFIWQFGLIDDYWGHPLVLGATKTDGTTEYCDFSPLLLDVADCEVLPTPKFQLKIAKNTLDAIWDKALRMLHNHRSLVLPGEEGRARHIDETKNAAVLFRSHRDRPT